MPEPVLVGQLPRFTRPNEKQNPGQISLTYKADFTGEQTYSLNLTLQNQNRTFGIPRTVFIDNGSNPNNVELTCKGTGFQATIPAYANGFFPVDAIENDTLEFYSAGGSPDLVVITIFNFVIPAGVWFTTDPLAPGFQVEAVTPAATALTDRNNALAAGVAEDVFPAVATPRNTRFTNLSDYVVYYNVGNTATGAFAAGDKQIMPGQEIVLPYRTAQRISFYCANVANIQAEEWTV